MKDLNESQKTALGRPDPQQTLPLINRALDQLWHDTTKSRADKVAGDCTYEQLVTALLHAEASELARQEIMRQDQGRPEKDEI